MKADPPSLLGPESGSGHRLVVLADWNDVEAAVPVGVAKGEAAVVSSTSPSQHERVYQLLTVWDEPGELTARWLRVAQGDPNRSEAALESGEGVRIELVCRIGRFGDAARERAVLVGVGSRLEDLAGVEYRKIR